MDNRITPEMEARARTVMEMTGVSDSKALFIVALEMGLIDGDEIAMDREVKEGHWVTLDDDQKEGRFVTLKDDRVIFIQGPSEGAGSITYTDAVSEMTRDEYIGHLCLNMDEAQVGQVREWLAKVPSEHLVGLNGIALLTEQTPRVWRVPLNEFLLSEDGFIDNVQGTNSGLMVLGSYATRKYEDGSVSKHIVLSGPQDFSQSVLLHEIGHHATWGGGEGRGGNEMLMHRATDVVGSIRTTWLGTNTQEEFRDRLAKAGLRFYSLSHPLEFLADAYATRRMGTRAQNTALNKAWKANDPNGGLLEDLLK